MTTSRKNFLICEDTILFRPVVLWKEMMFFKRMRVERKSYLGKILKSFFKGNFTGFKSVLVLYLFYYRKEYVNYAEFIKNYFNLTDKELESIGSYFLLYNKGNLPREFYHFYEFNSIIGKLDDYFGGEFIRYED